VVKFVTKEAFRVHGPPKQAAGVNVELTRKPTLVESGVSLAFRLLPLKHGAQPAA
jgi:hypothetical protein